MNTPRVSVKGIIVHDGKLLVIQKLSGKDAFYILPGGGQERFETLFEALKREVLEETGYTVTPQKILFVRDYIAKNHEFAHEHPHVHQLEIHVSASLHDVPQKQATQLDDNQTGVVWLPLTELKSAPIYPKELRVQNFLEMAGAYWGDVN